MLSINMNRKLKAGNIGVFNLPAIPEVCGTECPKCYAKKAQKIYKAVLPYRMRNWEASKQADFVPKLVNEIVALKKPLAAIRVHESGDFYSQEYIDKWHQVAQYRDKDLFYAYTKRLKDFDFSALAAMDNFILIDSCQYGPINYGDGAFVQGMAAKGAFVCPACTAITCNNGCRYCLTKAAQRSGVVFHAH